LVVSVHPETPEGANWSFQFINEQFAQGQGQFRKLAELDSRQVARQGEPAGLRVSQIKGLRGGVLHVRRTRNPED